MSPGAVREGWVDFVVDGGATGLLVRVAGTERGDGSAESATWELPARSEMQPDEIFDLFVEDPRKD